MKSLSCFILFLVIACACSESLVAQTDAHPVDAQEGSTERQSDQTKQAVIKSQPDPEKPKKTSETGVKGTVVLKAILRASGQITDIKLVKVIHEGWSDKEVKDMVKKTIKAARGIKFNPAMKDCHPVSQYVQIEYEINKY
jgi:hypothetical protein